MVTISLYVTPALPDLPQPRAAYCSCTALLAWQVTVQTKGQHLGVRSSSICGDAEEQKLRKSAIDLLSLVSRCSAWSAKHWKFPDPSSSLSWHQPSSFECCIAPLLTAVAQQGYMIADALSASPSRLRAVSHVIPAETLPRSVLEDP